MKKTVLTYIIYFICTNIIPVVSTFAGSGISGSIDGIGTVASFYYPTEICADASSNIYIGDSGNNKIIKITITTNLPEPDLKNSFSIYPNPSNGYFTFNSLEKESVIEIYDITGRLIFNTTTQNTSETIDLSDKQKGVYFYRIISDKKGMQLGKIIIQ